MIRTIASCPFCPDGVVALDDRLEIVLNPDSARPICKHLGLFWVNLSGGQNWNWPRDWERGQGMGQMKTNDVRTELIVDLTLDMALPEDLPHASYVVVGATAGAQEDRKPGSGEFWVYPPGSSPELVLFDGCAIYAYDAAALVAAVHEKVRMIRLGQN